jgi:hypothetical protein
MSQRILRPLSRDGQDARASGARFFPGGSRNNRELFNIYGKFAGLAVNSGNAQGALGVSEPDMASACRRLRRQSCVL